MSEERQVLEEALARAGLDEVELFCRRARRGVSRFSRAELNQNAVYDERTIQARVAVGRRLGTSTTSDLTVESVTLAIADARQAADRSPPIECFPGFAPGDPGEPDLPERSAASTEACSPAERAEILRGVLERVWSEPGGGLEAAGTLETSATEVAVVTTAGARRQARATVATARLFVTSSDSSSFVGAVHRDVRALDPGAMVEQALERCRRGHDPVEVSPGAWDVVLEPEAVTELLEWFAYASLGAREVEDGQSALSGKIGSRITGEWVDLVDDALDPSELGMGLPFDAEGTIRRRVDLVRGGVAMGAVTDRIHAARAGSTSTGHAVSGSPDDGPKPVNLFLGGGDRTVDDLVASVERGLYVTRFHYVNGLLDTRKALMTGMTRDGTFLIENGKITRGVRNLRFTESLLGALERTEAASRSRRAVPTWWSDGGAHVAPAILVRGFRFTGERAPSTETSAGGSTGSW